MFERFKETVLKTVGPKGPVGSNPTRSGSLCVRLSMLAQARRWKRTNRDIAQRLGRSLWERDIDGSSPSIPKGLGYQEPEACVLWELVGESPSAGV